LHILHILYIFVTICFFSESLFNIKEDMRAKPTSWYNVGWMPIIDEEKSCRPGQGYDSDAARNVRVHQECWRHFLRPFVNNTDTKVIVFGDNKARQIRHGVGAALGDQQVHIVFCTYFAYLPSLCHIDRILHILHIQEFDKWTCEPHPSCRRCYAGIPEFLRTDLPSAPKSMDKRREEIEHEASGDGLRERGIRGVVEGSVVQWDRNGANVRPGPNAKFYESCRKECGAHMTYNAFWEVPNFCVQQMLPRDGMHAIDLGAIIRLILAILRKFWVCVELILNMEGLAAKKLEERMRRCLARRDGPDGQW
jgi:hypothetical protein